MPTNPFYMNPFQIKPADYSQGLSGLSSSMMNVAELKEKRSKENTSDAGSNEGDKDFWEILSKIIYTDLLNKGI